MYKTVINAWVPLELAVKLESMAKERGESISSLLAGVLASFAGMEIAKSGKGRDGREDEAIAIIKARLKATPDATVRALMQELEDHGIKRKKTRVTELLHVLQMPDGSLRAIYRAHGVCHRADAVHRAQGHHRTEVTGHAIAAIQQRMERVLRSKGLLTHTALYQLTNGRRDGTVNWDKALDALYTARLIGQTEKGRYFWAKVEA